MNKKAAILFSGGKDSSLALFKTREKYDVRFLLSVIPKSEDAMLWHKPNLKILKEQAESLGIDLVYIKGGEDELEDFRKLLKKVKNKIEVVVGGGIASNYQGERFRKIVEEEGLEIDFPLWKYNPEDIWKELLKNKFKIILTKIACEGLSSDWLNIVIDEDKFKKLKELSKKYKFRLDFEGGEAESLTIWMPGMKEEIKVKGKIRQDGEFRYFLDIN